MLNMIVAMDSKGGIGVNNELPWRIQQDMKLFREMTKSSVVCMGRKTWESIPAKFRPLPDRLNVVLTTKGFGSLGTNAKNVIDAEDIMEVLAMAQTQEVWVIGGANVYEQFYGYLDFAVVTHVDPGGYEYNCDAGLRLPDNFVEFTTSRTLNVMDTKSGIPVNVRFSVYKVTKDESEPIRRYGRGLAERVLSNLMGW
jgi:dihydrofolate reductase